MSHKFPSHVSQIEANYFHVDEDSDTRGRKMHEKYNRMNHNEWNDKT